MTSGQPGSHASKVGERVMDMLHCWDVWQGGDDDGYDMVVQAVENLRQAVAERIGSDD